MKDVDWLKNNGFSICIMVIDGLHGLALAPGGFRRSAPTSPLPSPGGLLHRIAASSASGKKTVFPPFLTSKAGIIAKNGW